MNKIGLIGMSAKPFHAGHYGLIEIAASQNDEVYLYVSLSDRKRTNEVPILGKSMELIWKRYIEPILPDNVIITYGGSPISNIFAALENADDIKSNDVFQIYADPVDLKQNFRTQALTKAAPRLLKNNQIKLIPITRSNTINISGTQMRSFLNSGDKESFTSYLPAGLNSKNKNAIWNILNRDINESFLYDYLKFSV